MKIEDYAVIGNCASAALVGKNGSIDWLAFPRFDSGACFAALLGNEDNGRWIIAPAHAGHGVSRRYRKGTLVLETEFSTPQGRCVLIDCMDRAGESRQLIRMVRGIAGSVRMCMELKIRLEYGSAIPWVSRLPDGRMRAIAGPDQLVLGSSVEVRGEDMATVADFSVDAGQEVSFVLAWNPSHLDPAPTPDAAECIQKASDWWTDWSSQHVPCGDYSEAVQRSLITLKALSFEDTGGIVAAVTTSLPEEIGGSRNWDYRYCWLRDASFTLFALMNSGFTEEARSWRDWLLRAIAGSASQMQILYGVAGERRHNEYEIPWLSGYENSKPVRIGNGATLQIQLDVFGEVLALLYEARHCKLADPGDSWGLERSLVEHLATIWEQPDSGIWEVRGPERHFTQSKVMAWLAFDRAIRSAEEFALECDIEQWRKVRQAIHDLTCEQGFNAEMNSFTQYFGGQTLDASLLLMPITGFLPPDDPRVRGTIAAVEKYLLRDGFVARYNTEDDVDGVGGNEGAFLACSFWLADNYVAQERHDEARAMFERLLALRNDVGLLAEEYDVAGKRQVGNFPQAFSHVALVNTALTLNRRRLRN